MKKEPKWIDRILSIFLKSVEWTNLNTPVSQTFTYRCKKIDKVWQIVISPWMHEIYGGRRDGALKTPKYESNILMVADEFDTVSYIGFDTDRMESSIEGTVGKSSVVLIFRKQPPKTRTRKLINTFTGQVTKVVKEQWMED